MWKANVDVELQKNVENALFVSVQPLKDMRMTMSQQNAKKRDIELKTLTSK